jgi:hypothetical protein
LGQEARSVERAESNEEETIMNIAVAANAIPGPSLTRAQIVGRLSLVERGTLTLAAERGLTVHVRTGSLWIADAADGRYRQVRAGECFAALRDGRLAMRADTRSEIEIDWPQPAAERLSPGLEPLTLAC